MIFQGSLCSMFHVWNYALNMKKNHIVLWDVCTHYWLKCGLVKPPLINRLLVAHIYVGNFGHHWFRYLLKHTGLIENVATMKSSFAWATAAWSKEIWDLIQIADLVKGYRKLNRQYLGRQISSIKESATMESSVMSRSYWYQSSKRVRYRGIFVDSLNNIIWSATTNLKQWPTK